MDYFPHQFRPVKNFNFVIKKPIFSRDLEIREWYFFNNGGGGKKMTTPLGGSQKNITPFQRKSQHITIVQRGGQKKFDNSRGGGGPPKNFRAPPQKIHQPMLLKCDHSLNLSKKENSPYCTYLW